MWSNEYDFVTRWRAPGTVEQIGAVLGDTASLPRWCAQNWYPCSTQ